jgi:ABC-type Mn2+/Zn2+ transport system ATPase subunit
VNGPLVLEDVSVTFGSRRALEGVSFAAPTGCIIGVIGPNGAGKSTLFRAILDLIPYSGSISLSGHAAYVPQGDRTAVDFPVTARDVALMGRYRAQPWWRPLAKEDRAAADAALDEVGMTDHRGCTFGELSGGQRQRVILARALAHGGQVLLLDEPLTGVDTTSARIIDEAIRRLRDTGHTLLVATHDLNDAADNCDRLLFLNRRVVAYGAPDETFTQSTLAQTYSDILIVGDPDGDGRMRVLDEGAHHHHDHGHDHDHPADHHH